MSAMEIDDVPALTSAAIRVDEDDEDSSSIPEDEYEIEAILSHEVGHFGHAEKNDVAYLVSWKGYGPEHNSWVRETDAENARDMLNAYWDTASKDGVAIKANGKGYTGAKSNKTRRAVKKESPETGSTSASTSTGRGKRTGRTIAQEEFMAKKRMKTAAQASYTRAGLEITDVSAMEDDDDFISDRQMKRMKPEEQAKAKRRQDSRRYLSMPDWEQVIKHVETVEKADNGRLIAFVVFENNERYAFEAAVVNHRCPQKVIKFYESRLRFRPEAADLPPLTTASTLSQQTTAADEATTEATSEEQAPTSSDQVIIEDHVAAAIDAEVARLNETVAEEAPVVISSDVVESSGREEGELGSSQL